MSLTQGANSSLNACHGLFWDSPPEMNKKPIVMSNIFSILIHLCSWYHDQRLDVVNHANVADANNNPSLFADGEKNFP